MLPIEHTCRITVTLFFNKNRRMNCNYLPASVIKSMRSHVLKHRVSRALRSYTVRDIFFEKVLMTNKKRSFCKLNLMFIVTLYEISETGQRPAPYIPNGNAIRYELIYYFLIFH